MVDKWRGPPKELVLALIGVGFTMMLADTQYIWDKLQPSVGFVFGSFLITFVVTMALVFGYTKLE